MHGRVLDILPVLLLTVLGVTAVYTDLRFGRIYNKLTVTCIIAGVMLSLVRSGLTGLLGSVAGAGLVLVLFMLFAPRTGMGGGDIKMMMAVGALMGLRFTVWAMLLSAVTGGVLALAVLVWRGALVATIHNMLVGLITHTPVMTPSGAAPDSHKGRFRYSPAIAIGSFLALWLKPEYWT